MPPECVNALELANRAAVELPERFYPVGFYRSYNFASPSTMKPTQARAAHGLSDGHPDLTP